MDEIISRIRERIDHLREEDKTITPTAIPIDRAIGRAHAWIDQVRSIVNGDHVLKAFASGLPPNNDAILNYCNNDQKFFAFALWLDADRAKKKIESGIRELYKREGFKTDDPGQRPSEIAAEIFQLEINEERRIAALGDSGILISRRSDANPEAILAAAIEEPSALESGSFALETHHDED